jgi:hypothetical protein
MTRNGGSKTKRRMQVRDEEMDDEPDDASSLHRRPRQPDYQRAPLVRHAPPAAILSR